MVKLPAVPKAHSFGWRCGRDALPVGSHLRDTGLFAGACPLCNSGLEDTLHALRDCPDSLLALRQAGLLRPSSRRARHRRRTGLTLLRLLSPRTRWLCSSPSFGASGGDGIPGCMSVRSTPCL
ncbi:hypothetical protein V6N12_037379 [Hibiscus sabdariffa]|uniref:Reverse transcriptase zinc-binding domain-containing protein n=1 Tax=Hibiscus sabdariffa TaxID=183260 RepID=A0ABR2BZM0_9ROSI